jgi:hypothetical protein
MEKISLSLCISHGIEPDYFSAITAPFEKMRNSPVSNHLMMWDGFKQELTAVAFHRLGKTFIRWVTRW